MDYEVTREYSRVREDFGRCVTPNRPNFKDENRIFLEDLKLGKTYESVSRIPQEPETIRRFTVVRLPEEGFLEIDMAGYTIKQWRSAADLGLCAYSDGGWNAWYYVRRAETKTVEDINEE